VQCSPAHPAAARRRASLHALQPLNRVRFEFSMRRNKARSTQRSGRNLERNSARMIGLLRRCQIDLIQRNLLISLTIKVGQRPAVHHVVLDVLCSAAVLENHRDGRFRCGSSRRTSGIRRPRHPHIRRRRLRVSGLRHRFRSGVVARVWSWIRITLRRRCLRAVWRRLRTID
jgi:hypothetical protein